EGRQGENGGRSARAGRKRERAPADIGPGTYTWMTQLAAEMLGVPIENVTARRFRAAGCAGRRRIVHRLIGRLRHPRRLSRCPEGTARTGAEAGAIAARWCEAPRRGVRRRPDPAQ